MRDLPGFALADPKSRIAACLDLKATGKSRYVALTLGCQGAILATPDGVWRA